MVPPEAVRPGGPTPTGVARARWLPFAARRAAELARADVVHVHYATSAPLIRGRGLPQRPYLLHLHGTDIREQWRSPATHDLVQRAVDGATKVYFTNLDTAENAQRARADAEYMPPFVDPRDLPAWTPAGDRERPRILFASRWGPEKGIDRVLEVVSALRRAVPQAQLLGLDWGIRASDARAAGVELVARKPHNNYLAWLATADVVVGQATGIVSVSELEAMAIGAPLALPGTPLAYPDGKLPPTLYGRPEDVVDQLEIALQDPIAAADRLGAREWVLRNFVADLYVEALQSEYRAAAGGSTRRGQSLPAE